MEYEAIDQSVKRYIEALATGDTGIIDALYAEDATVEDPVGSEPVRGKAAIMAFYAAATQNGLFLELTGPIRATATAVAFPFRARVGESGPTIEGIDAFEFNDEGAIVSMRAYFGPANVTP